MRFSVHTGQNRPVPEIERLIKKLELDKEILAEQEGEAAETEAEPEKPFVRRV